MKSNKEATIYDIANALKISASTVSRGLKDHPHVRKEIKRKILLKAREMGYQQNKFASNLRQKRTNTIGVILPRLDSYFMSTVVSGMEKVANLAGYNLIISQSQESVKKEASNILTMFNSRVDGLLISLSYDTKNMDHINIFFEKSIPIVFFDRVCEHSDCKSIVIDNYKAGYEVTSHLISQGCKRIAHLAGSLFRNVYSDRYEGYKQALADNGIENDNKLLYISDLTNDAGIEITRKILSLKQKPDGVFAANDTSAVALICELKKAGVRIPEDIAVAGFNNDPVSRVVVPNLTTIDYPGREMGEIAASTLINQLNGRQTAKINSIVLGHELIIRQSTMKRRVTDN